MDQFRQAKCTQCAASFKVPATFTAAKAKCPKCGGVVEVGAVQGAAPKAEASAPKPVPASVPAAKPVAAPAPKPAAAPVVSKPAATKPAAPAAKPAVGAVKPVAPSVRSAAESAASKVKAGGAARKGKDDEGAGEKRERHRHEPKKKSMAPAMLGLAGLLVFGGVGYWYFGIKLPADDKAKQELEAAATARRLAELAEQAAKDKAEMDAANATHINDLAGAAAAKGEEVAIPDATAPADDAAKEAAATAKKPDAAAGSDKAFEEIDLSALPVLPKFSKSTDEDWEKYQADAKLLTDPAAGAAGNRAGKRIEEAGRAAVPALLNQFRTINPAVEDGFRAGDLIQKMLERICKGMNFGWKYSTEPKDVYYNKKAIQSWFKQWEKVGEDDAAWAKFTKQDVKKTDGDAEGGDAPPAKPASGLDDF